MESFMFRWFGNLKIKTKLLIIIITVFLLSFVAQSVSNQPMIRGTIREMYQENIFNVINNIKTIAKASVTTSIRNYLQASAEKGKQFVEHYYKKYQAGFITEEEAFQEIKSLFKEPSFYKIGKNGYMSIVSIGGELLIHPESEGVNIKDYDFMKKVKKMKNGYLEYEWKNENEDSIREKAGWVSYFKPWDLLVWASAYKDEFVGLVDIKSIRDDILNVKLGDTGYPYIVDTDGNVIIHPTLEGQNVYNIKDEKGKYIIKEVINDRNGDIRYYWKNSGEDKARWKKAYFQFMDSIDWVIIGSIYEDEIYRPIDKITNITILVMVIIFVVISVITFFFVRYVSKPIDLLIRGFKKAEKGELEEIPDINRKDEIGRLVYEFNGLIIRLKDSFEKIKNQNNQIKEYNENLQTMVNEKTKQLTERNSELIDLNAQLIVIDAKNERLQSLIRQFTPKATWSHVLDTLETESLEDSMEEIEVTMLFADIKNFTKFAEKFPPKTVLQSLNEIFDMVTKIVYDNKGDIDKFIGDAFFAVFEDPFDCVKATWEISKKLDEINDKNMMSGKTPLYFRYGINTGVVVRGNIGGEIRKDNTLIGDAVNAAQRLEHESIPGQILIARSTYEHIKSKIEVSNEIELSVKGKKNPIRAFYIEKLRNSLEQEIEIKEEKHTEEIGEENKLSEKDSSDGTNMTQNKKNGTKKTDDVKDNESNSEQTSKYQNKIEQTEQKHRKNYPYRKFIHSLGDNH